MKGFGAVCLTLVRLALAAWVGGATLFVINGVRLATSSAFDSAGRDHLALIRFPPYYLFGFVLVGIALAGLLVGGSFRLRWLVVGLVAAGLVGMLVDYFAVYLPLERMVTPPGQPRTADFTRLHRMSEIINTLHVGVCLLAAVLVCRPLAEEPNRDTRGV